MVRGKREKTRLFEIVWRRHIVSIRMQRGNLSREMEGNIVLSDCLSVCLFVNIHLLTRRLGGDFAALTF